MVINAFAIYSFRRCFLPQLSLDTIVDHEDTSRSVVTRIINRGNGASQKFNHEYWMRMHRLLFDLTRTVSIFSGLHVRRIIPASFPDRTCRRCRMEGLAQAAQRLKTATSYFSAALPRNSILIQPEFCTSVQRKYASFNFTDVPTWSGRARSLGKSRRPHNSAGFNYAACKGFHVIK